tara:strand:+ start:3336 stop:4331 length:996 start_codon:yes stop_codon:yes gene_type:complete
MMHEHLLIEFARWRRDAGSLDIPPYDDVRSAGPINLKNRHWISYYGKHPDEYSLDEEDVAIEEAGLFGKAGGGTIVDVTNPDLRRDPQALKRISKATNLHVVMGCGTYVGSMHPPDMDERTSEELANEMVSDMLQGADGTAIRSGIIGEIGTEFPITENEEKSLVAAALAQQNSGAAISIHPGRDSKAPLAVMKHLLSAGADPERVIMGHLDRTLFEEGDFTELADTGCYLEFDLFGQESSYYAHGPIDMPNDATRIDHIIALLAKGFGEKILLSQDICQKTNTTTYGGHGYAHILENVVPMMKRKRIGMQDIDRMLIHNPARILPLVDST